MFKSTTLKIFALALCLALLAGCMMACKSEEQLVAAQQEQPVPQTTVNYVDLRSTLTVRGSGKASLMPDIATLYLGVRTEHKEASAAQQENAVLLAAVLEAVKAIGIPDGDIETDALQLSERYDYDKTPYEIMGYTAENGMRVTVRNLELIGRLLTDAAAAGATSINGPTYSFSDTGDAYAKALAIAMEDANAKAAALAAGAAVQLNPLPVSVSEQSASEARPYEAEVNEMRSMAEADGALAAPPVSVTEQDITAQVTVVYEITR